MSTNLLKGMAWRRAVKKFANASEAQKAAINVQPILEAIQHAPSSFGITPYQVHCISSSSSKELQNKVAQNTFDNEEKVNAASHVCSTSPKLISSEYAY